MLRLDTTTASGRLALEFSRLLPNSSVIWSMKPSMTGLATTRGRGRKFALTKAQVRLTQVAIPQRDTSISDMCEELGIKR